MDKVLIDSDVIFDSLFSREPFDRYATEIISLCESKVIDGYLTPVIVANVYYLLRQKASHEAVVEKMNELLLVVKVLVMDKPSILRALNSKFKDFEDALQHFAATSNGKLDIILTRNLKDYKQSEIPVMTPEAYLQARASSLS
ncbi:PIN domain-containing protein [Persicitalea sp.]|uniref:PIN domain-containing protein n=1 Tax=Persicitalea sp. TaxID=3100273 RepID=UPI003593AF1A